MIKIAISCSNFSLIFHCTSETRRWSPCHREWRHSSKVGVAQQIAPVQEATSPFQYALTTKAGGECVAHAIQSLIDLDSRATVILSRVAPFVLQFSSEPSQYFWTDDCGDTHVIHQGEGSE